MSIELPGRLFEKDDIMLSRIFVIGIMLASMNGLLMAADTVVSTPKKRRFSSQRSGPYWSKIALNVMAKNLQKVV